MKPVTIETAGDQAEVFSFLANPASWPGNFVRVDVLETHGALVYLSGDMALKVKRAVKLAYLDFSTLELRHRFSQRELEINQPHAPDLYRAVVPITRESDGNLAIAGRGMPVEWAVEMRRFDQEQLLSHVATSTGVDRQLAITLGDMIASYQGKLKVADAASDPMPQICASLISALRSAPELHKADLVEQFSENMLRGLTATAGLREARAASGFVRRCHGDLHLGNIVMWHGRPVPFDAIEFDEGLATVDTLYDLAFLIMDLWRHRAHEAANVVLNRYLWRTGEPQNDEGLAALPLFLASRAGVRAMVALDRGRLGAGHRPDLEKHVRETLELAVELVTPKPPTLIAIGGLSGTGKSTVAGSIAPYVGAAPGALHLRTDLERKRMAGVGEFDHLPADEYTAQSSAITYARVLERARLALTAGHSVIVDAVSARPDERRALAELAAGSGVRFHGLWLDALPDNLKSRVSARVRDASDATAEVVEQQLQIDVGHIDWVRVPADGSPATVLASAWRALDLPVNLRSGAISSPA